jgi:hypothetical protein
MRRGDLAQGVSRAHPIGRRVSRSRLCAQAENKRREDGEQQRRSPRAGNGGGPVYTHSAQSSAGVRGSLRLGPLGQLSTRPLATTASKEKTTTLTGTAVWTESTTTIQGTLAGALGKGTYTGTLNLGPVYENPGNSLCNTHWCADVTGTITFSFKNGDLTAAVQPGSLVGLETIPSHSWEFFRLTLQIVSGTQVYAKTTGTLTLTYTSTWVHQWESSIDGSTVYVDQITDSGTLTGRAH